MIFSNKKKQKQFLAGFAVLGFALILLSCADNPALEYPNKEYFFPKSSSSEAEISSSSSMPSSSSVTSSSSRASSSSSVPRSSSSAGLCAGFIDGTTRDHYLIAKEQFCDSRDGSKYVYVEIGEGATAQIWMAENLKYKDAGSKCSEECDKYGRLYTWARANDVCPSGWRLPGDEDWNALMAFIKPSCSGARDCEEVGTKLKEGEFGGTDDYGFSALLGGFYEGSVGKYVTVQGLWWSSNEDDSNANKASYWSMYFNNSVLDQGYNDKPYFLSVRCLRE